VCILGVCILGVCILGVCILGVCILGVCILGVCILRCIYFGVDLFYWTLNHIYYYARSKCPGKASAMDFFMDHFAENSLS
jgi:hypothetical protein